MSLKFRQRVLKLFELPGLIGRLMIPQDYHMHSNFSPDCEVPMEAMCQRAIEVGIPEIGFTEHYDLIPGEVTRDWFRPAPWWEELKRCRQRFANQLTIRAGIEIGEPHRFQAESKAMLAAWPFDYALGSLHWVGNESVFDRTYFSKRKPDEAWQLFYEELERMTRIGGFDILSHFDVPVRVGFDVYGSYDPARYEEWIRPALRNCIENGIALDLNTAAFRRTANQLTPGKLILSWYAEMGGERVTLGSDAHRPVNIGMKLDVAMDIARSVGIHYVTQFVQHQATMIPI